MKKTLILLFSVFSICFLQFTACLQAQSSNPTDSQAIIQQLKAENESGCRQITLKSRNHHPPCALLDAMLLI